MDIFSGLPSNPFAWLFTVIVAILALILAYRSVPQKVIKCNVESNELITNKQSILSGLNIYYGDEQVNRVTVTKLTFWNNSFPPINKLDLIETEPFSLSIVDGKILDISVSAGDEASNLIKVSSIDESTAKISFDYLNRKEGGVVQIIHTGDDNVIVSKKIIGGKIVRKSKNRIWLNEVISTFLCSVGATGFAFGIEKYGIISNIIFIILFVFLLGLAIALSWYKNRDFIPSNCKNKNQAIVMNARVRENR